MVFNFKINPQGQPSFSVFSMEEASELLSHIFSSKDAYLDYSVPHVAEFYGEDQARWVKQKGAYDGQTPLAYELVYDYRSGNAVDHGWGHVVIKDHYIFPAELVEHRLAMLDRMKKEGRIKGSSRIPRVAALQVTENGPSLHLQIAEYYDQVGTNLTLDCKLPKPITVGNIICKTVREWDRAQAGIQGRSLPTFETSRLANTIGVGVGLSARDNNNVKHFVYRYRTPKAPVYPDTWHLPVSFALEIDPSVTGGEQYNIETLVRNDFPEELFAEAQLLRRDFGSLRPIAFCRDLTRGGKPQFFLELECNLPLADLLVKIGASQEYTRLPRTLSDGATTNLPMSPELACFLALTSSVKRA